MFRSNDPSPTKTTVLQRLIFVSFLTQAFNILFIAVSCTYKISLSNAHLTHSYLHHQRPNIILNNLLHMHEEMCTRVRSSVCVRF